MAHRMASSTAVLASTFDKLSPLATPTALLSGRASEPGWPHGEQAVAWRQYLLSLEEGALSLCERCGLHRVSPSDLPPMPPSLQMLCEAVAAGAAVLGRGIANGQQSSSSCSSSCAWRQSAEKAAQVGALLAAVTARLDNLSRVKRVVDVGCGKGHLTAHLHRALGVPACGIDFDAALIETARNIYPNVSFEARDVVQSGLVLADGDLVVGLHPCGALGEAVVRAVSAHEGGVALLMVREQKNQTRCRDQFMTTVPPLKQVPCCWHKQGTPVRAPLSRLGEAAGFALPHSALKKASMALTASGSLQARRARYELRELLRSRGVDEVELAERREMDGIHPRKARRGLRALAAEALPLRHLEPIVATEDELARAVAAARGPFERARRMSLLEPVLGELIELLCTLDRALALCDAGLSVSVFAAFEEGASDRNLAILAERRIAIEAERSPSTRSTCTPMSTAAAEFLRCSECSDEGQECEKPS